MGAVLVVGDAGLDVLAKYDRAVAPGGDARAQVRTALGGAGANTAAWLAHCGADPVLVGRVGVDPAGAQVRAELAAAGVRCALTDDPRASTCCVVVLVDGEGQRSMLADRGAGRRLQPEDLSADLLAQAQHLHLSGYVLLDAESRPAGMAMLQAARAAGVRTSVDPQAANHLRDPESFLAAVDGVDLLLPNTDELSALTGSRDPESARALLDRVGAVALTRGPDGACWVDPTTATVSVPAAPAECVDSTGAGDAFDAALLAAWLNGAGPEESLRAGVLAGSTAVGHLGAHPVATAR
jgi:sugar/nucleoside kinase (ribokinase family)